MDPVSVIVGALVMGAGGAAKKVGGKAVRDAYAGLKGVIVDRYKHSTEVAALEKNLSSTTERRALETALAKTDVRRDQEVLQLVKRLTEALADAPQTALSAAGIQIEDVKAMNAQIGDIDVSGLAVGVSVKNVQLKRNLRFGNVKVRNPK